MLNNLVSEGGSRRIIASLMEKLGTVYEETQAICDQIAARSEEMEELNCLETLRINMDMCLAHAEDYLEARQDEPPSTNTFTSSWVNQYGLKELPEKTRKDEGLDESQQRGIPFTNLVENNMFSFREADESSGNDQISQGFDGVPMTKESGNEMISRCHKVRSNKGERNQQAGIDFVSCVEANEFSRLEGVTPLAVRQNTDTFAVQDRNEEERRLSSCETQLQRKFEMPVGMEGFNRNGTDKNYTSCVTQSGEFGSQSNNTSQDFMQEGGKVKLSKESGIPSLFFNQPNRFPSSGQHASSINFNKTEMDKSENISKKQEKYGMDAQRKYLKSGNITGNSKAEERTAVMRGIPLVQSGKNDISFRNARPKFNQELDNNSQNKSNGKKLTTWEVMERYNELLEEENLVDQITQDMAHLKLADGSAEGNHTMESINSSNSLTRSQRLQPRFPIMSNSYDISNVYSVSNIQHFDVCNSSSNSQSCMNNVMYDSCIMKNVLPSHPHMSCSIFSGSKLQEAAQLDGNSRTGARNSNSKQQDEATKNAPGLDAVRRTYQLGV